MSRQSKRVALLAFLAAANPKGPHRRQQLLSLFWPDSDEPRARAALNQALHVLRSEIGPRIFEGRGRDEVAIDPDAVWCDAAAFDDALDAGRCEEALSLYAGDFLEGFHVAGAPDFERWVDQERARLRLRASDAAWDLAERRASEGDPTAAARWATRAAELVPGDEAVARRLMLFLASVGDRSAAIRAYETFVQCLAEEYDLEPSAETEAIAARIREEDLTTITAAQGPPEPPAPASPGLPPWQAPPPRGARRARWPVTTGALGVAAFGLGAAWATLQLEPRDPPPAATLPVDLDLSPPLASGIAGTTVVLSRDGASLVYVGRGADGPELFLRSTDRLEAVTVAGSHDATHPFFSPDGEWLAFVQGNALEKVRVEGGEPIEVTRIDAEVQGASWTDDETIIFATMAGLWQVPAAGGAPHLLAPSDAEKGEHYRWPDALPGSEAAVMTIASPAGFELATVSFADGAVQRLGIGGTSPRFIESGVLVFARLDQTLLVVPFEPPALRVTGPVKSAMERVHVGLAGAAKVGVARATGALAYVPAQPANALYLVGPTEAEPVVTPGGWLVPGRFSPDGDVFFTTYRPEGIWPDIFAVNLDDGAMLRLTADSGSATPIPSRDGRRLAYASRPGGRGVGYEIRLLDLDGSAPPETLLDAAVGQRPTDFTADDRGILFVRIDPATLRDVWVLWLDGSGEPRPYLRGPGHEHGADVSPDGKWVAFVSDGTGRDEVYLATFPNASDWIRVSSAGGREPRWAPEGDVLYYRTDEGLVVVAVGPGVVPDIGPARVVLDDAPYDVSLWGTSYDIHPDGERFALASSGPPSADLVLVLNWLERIVEEER